MIEHACLAVAVSLLMATPSLPGLIAWALEDDAPTAPTATPEPVTEVELEEAA